MAKVLSNGLMELNIMGIGKIIRCMEKDNSVGLTVVYTKVIMRMTRNMVKVCILGLTVECTKVDFIMGNNTEKVYTDNQMDKKFTEYGRKERKVLYVRIRKNLTN